MDTHLVKLCFQNHQFVGKMLTQIHFDNLAMKIGDLMGYEWGFSEVFSVWGQTNYSQCLPRFHIEHPKKVWFSKGWITYLGPSMGCSIRTEDGIASHQSPFGVTQNICPMMAHAQVTKHRKPGGAALVATLIKRGRNWHSWPNNMGGINGHHEFKTPRIVWRDIFEDPS